jgi:hypothetical protein
MPPRSKVITMLPAHIRQEVERRLFENGFRDYEGLAQWVRGQGYEISDDSLWRYGHSLQQQLTAMRLTVRLAGELPQDHESSMARVLIAMAQQKALTSLAENEEIKPADLNAIANLTRAAIAQQRWAAELKAQAQQPHQAAADGKRALPDKTRPSGQTLHAIAPAQVNDTVPSAAGESPADRIEPCRETTAGAERRAYPEQHSLETAVAVEENSATARDKAFEASIQSALYCSSPRIAEERTPSEKRTMPLSVYRLPHSPTSRTDHTLRHLTAGLGI